MADSEDGCRWHCILDARRLDFLCPMASEHAWPTKRGVSGGGDVEAAGDAARYPLTKPHLPKSTKSSGTGSASLLVSDERHGGFKPVRGRPKRRQARA